MRLSSTAPPPAATPPVLPAPRPAVTRPRLTLAGVSRHYGPLAAVADVTLEVASGEILGVLGPSGCGKSTLLRLIAGLDRPSAGTIAIDGHVAAAPHTFVEPERRQVGLVFQDHALFPHLTVAGNIRFGLKACRRSDADQRVREWLDRIALGHRGEDYPHQLSGGERQRVALARALAPRPRLLLMDEPFASLDDSLRARLRSETIALLRETGTTAVLVTHDAEEALRVTDRVALLDHGRLIECGTPRDLYAHPGSVAAARLFGSLTEVPGTCHGGLVETPLGTFVAPDLADSVPVRVCIRPSLVRLASAETPVEARVLGHAFLGHAHQALVSVRGVGDPIAVSIPSDMWLEVDARVYLHVDHAGVVVVPHRVPSGTAEPVGAGQSGV